MAVVLVTAVADRTAGGVGQALVADVADKDRRIRLMAVIRSVRNVGYALGGLVAGIAITVDVASVYHGTVLGVAAFYVLCAVLLARVRTAKMTAPRSSAKRVWAFRDRRYMGFAGLNTLLSLHVTTLNVLLPLWILTLPGVPAGFVAVPLIVNTVMVALLQLPATRGIASVADAGRAALASAFLLVAACGIFAVCAGMDTPASAVAVLLCGVFALTMAEMLQAAASWQISMDLAPERFRSQYLSTFNLSTTAERVIGPSLLALLVLTFRPWGWLSLAAVFAAGGAGTWWLARAGVTGACERLPPGAPRKSVAIPLVTRPVDDSHGS
jgi:MFS family permease